MAGPLRQCPTGRATKTAQSRRPLGTKREFGWRPRFLARFPIAGAAKQSIAQQRKKEWIASSPSLLAMTERRGESHHSSFRGAPPGPRKARPDDRLRPSPQSILPIVVMALRTVRARSGRHASAGLDAGVEASGPHDFAVRSKHLSSARFVVAHEPKPALPSRRAPKRCRVHRIPPRLRDDRDTPLCGVGLIRPIPVSTS